MLSEIGREIGSEVGSQIGSEIGRCKWTLWGAVWFELEWSGGVFTETQHTTTCYVKRRKKQVKGVKIAKVSKAGNISLGKSIGVECSEIR